jgi:hypothetical protein
LEVEEEEKKLKVQRLEVNKNCMKEAEKLLRVGKRWAKIIEGKRME